MKIEALVLAEDVQTRDGVEYVSCTCMERGTDPLLQMFDYSLREDERVHKGKLLGKELVIRVNTIRSIFAGRPQMQGKLVQVNGHSGPDTKTK